MTKDTSSLRSGIQQGHRFLPHLPYLVLEVLASAVRHQKQSRPTRKEEVKLSVFTDDIIIYVENSKKKFFFKATKISEFSNVVELQVNKIK